MQFADVAACSDVVASTTKRTQKVGAMAELLRRAPRHEVGAVVAFLVGDTPTGRIGVGWSSLGAARVEPAEDPSLSVTDVATAIERLAATTGPGSAAERRRLLVDLFGRATETEQGMLVAILGGELRQGALDGVVTAAVAKAATVPVAAVQRAAMLSGSLAAAATAALDGGAAALASIGLEPLRAVQPMLASPATDVAAALAATGPASVEWKLDGARVQVHRLDDDVRVFTRNLNDVTDRLGAVVDLVRGMPGGDLVLDGEVLGIDDSGRPDRFQDTMGDFGADAPGRGARLVPFFFDVLHVGSDTLVDEPLRVRRAVLEATVPADRRMPAVVTADPREAEAFFERAVATGHEGVVVKDLEAVYEAGRRGGSWRKVKPVHTFDLVVLAVEWGHGRRTGYLSNLHLGARGDDGTFVMVGKTFKGLTDELLRWQTQRFQELAIGSEAGRGAHVVHVRPEQVVEVAVDGVQASTRYPGGVALRFARVRRYRDDKRASDADHIDAVRSLLR